MSASYDCSGELNASEKAICNNEELSALDELMAISYQKASEVVGWMTAKELKQSQKNWIFTRNQCESDISCIYSKYTKRLRNISSGTLNFDVRNNVTSFIYMGKPIDGKCPKDETFTDWGGCVVWSPAGANFRGFSVNKKMAFRYSFVGSNGHTCTAGGQADNINGYWSYNDDHSSCSIIIKIGADGLSLSATKKCNDYCGMRAFGGMNQSIDF